MEMEFKDNSRRRTLVLVVGVLLALGAGAAAFMLSSQGGEEAALDIPTANVVVATELLDAREAIPRQLLTLLAVPVDASNEAAFRDPTLVQDRIAAIPILPNQPITPNMLTTATGLGSVKILEPNETIAPDSPAFRAVSLTVPAERAVGGLIAPGDRVDVLATLTFPVSGTTDADGLPLTNEDGEPISFTSGPSTKPMWLDVRVLSRSEGSDIYVLRMDMQQAEEVSLAQVAGAQFSFVLRPELDTRELDRSFYGETVDRVLSRYNYAIPETIQGADYPQPEAFPSPFPAEPYVELAPSPSPEPDDALIDIPIDSELETPEPDA
jgi:Flp pilus assembly protein CpaB